MILTEILKAAKRYDTIQKIIGIRLCGSGAGKCVSITTDEILCGN